MIKVENKYNVDDNVFYFNNGIIWHCHITRINIRVTQEGIKLTYNIVPYSNELRACEFIIVNEDEITANIEDVINIIPIR